MRECLQTIRDARRCAANSMATPRQHLSGFPRSIGFAVILHLLAVLWMAASPALHAAVHPDASEPEHSCCVTMFEAGNFHAPTMGAVQYLPMRSLIVAMSSGESFASLLS